MKRKIFSDKIKSFIYDYLLFIHNHSWQALTILLSAFVLGQFAAFLKWNIFFYLH
jgi:hypothetical protein